MLFSTLLLVGLTLIVSCNGAYVTFDDESDKFIVVEFDDFISWFDASSYCDDTYGTSVASIHSTSEQEDWSSMRNTSDSSLGNCWIGLRDDITETDWYWADGTSYDYDNWDYSEPNGDNVQNCVMAWRRGHGSDSGTWRDLQCNDTTFIEPASCVVCNQVDRTYDAGDPDPEIEHVSESDKFIVAEFTDDIEWVFGSDYCNENYGTTVGSIHSPSEQSDWMSLRTSSDSNCWIGLKDDITEGVWYWVDSTDVNYKIFESIEPNGGTEQNCVMGWKEDSGFGDGNWRDLQCNDTTFSQPASCVVCNQIDREYDSGEYFIQNTTESDNFIMVQFYDYINWTDAESYCISEFDTHLASIHSNDENSEWKSLRVSDSVNCWIGLKDDITEGSYYWADGSDYDYTNWNDIEPNGNMSQNCVMAWKETWSYGGGDGTWRDLQCSDNGQSNPVQCVICNQDDRTYDAFTTDDGSNDTDGVFIAIGFIIAAIIILGIGVWLFLKKKQNNSKNNIPRADSQLPMVNNDGASTITAGGNTSTGASGAGGDVAGDNYNDNGEILANTGDNEEGNAALPDETTEGNNVTA